MRNKCFKCLRPLVTCYCQHLRPLVTSTKFIIIMHPKERKKTIATGRMSWLNLVNAELWMGLDFNEQIASLSGDVYLLYPSEKSSPVEIIGDTPSDQRTFLVLDGTWSQAYCLLKENPILEQIPHLSFSSKLVSGFHVKKQPKKHCLATIESIHYCLQILEKKNVSEQQLSEFLLPFRQMVSYQVKCELDLTPEN